MYYVYRFLTKGNKIGYVGRTNNFLYRMTTHFGKNGHLPESFLKNVREIEVLEVKTKTDMKMLELYYISKHRPPFNKKDNHHCTLCLDEKVHKWLPIKEWMGERHPHTLLPESVASIYRQRFILDMAEFERLSPYREYNPIHHFHDVVQDVDRRFSYRQIRKYMKKEPLITGVIHFDYDVDSYLLPYGKELVCVTHLHGEWRSTIAESKDKSRKHRIISDKFDREIQMMDVKEHIDWLKKVKRWSLMWRHKPYKKGA